MCRNGAKVRKWGQNKQNIWQPTNWFAETERSSKMKSKKENDDGIFFRVTGGNKARKSGAAGSKLQSTHFVLGYWLQRLSAVLLTTNYIVV